MPKSDSKANDAKKIHGSVKTVQGKDIKIASSTVVKQESKKVLADFADVIKDLENR